MCKENKRVIFLVLISCIILAGALCGCTRRERLILDTGNADADVKAAGMAAEDTAGISGRTESEPGSEAGQEAEVSPDSGQPDQKDETAGEPGMAESVESALICVHVCGAVRNAGVYEMPAGSRVYEAVECAGGFTEEADEGYVNQAQLLSDGIKLVIPTKEQVRSLENGAADGKEQINPAGQTEVSSAEGYGVVGGEDKDSEDAAASADGKVNINTASEAQLCEIPGIGATRAAAIVAYRQQAGSFVSIEDIMKVSGIKEGTYAKIKDYIKVK